jgi:hypothetical protein
MTNFRDIFNDFPLPISSLDHEGGAPRLSAEAFEFLLEYALMAVRPDRPSGQMIWNIMSVAISEENDRRQAEDEAYDEEFRRPDIVVPSYARLLKEIAVVKKFVSHSNPKHAASDISRYEDDPTKEQTEKAGWQELWCRVALHMHETKEVTLGDRGGKGLIAQMPKIAMEVERAMLRAAGGNLKYRQRVLIRPAPAPKTLRRWIKAYTAETVNAQTR